jgi:anti-sigma factor RsiW
MNDCQDLTIREQLPEFVHGQLDESSRARVEAHLEWCASCAEELAIVRTVAGMSAPALDIQRIASAIPAYDRGSHARMPASRRQPWYRHAYVGMAAGVLVAALGVSGIVLSRQSGVASDTTQNATVRPGTSVAIGGEPAVLSGMASTSSGVALVNVGELSDEDLERLIRDMDSLDAAPPTEPEPAMWDGSIGEFEIEGGGSA